VTKADPSAPQVTCAGCSRHIDCCCFCDELGCPVAICYECLMQELKQTLPPPHPHGG
jgi:hypothetical protein